MLAKGFGYPKVSTKELGMEESYVKVSVNLFDEYNRSTSLPLELIDKRVEIVEC